jgi:hypothetical protein
MNQHRPLLATDDDGCTWTCHTRGVELEWFLVYISALYCFVDELIFEVRLVPKLIFLQLIAQKIPATIEMLTSHLNQRTRTKDQGIQRRNQL